MKVPKGSRKERLGFWGAQDLISTRRGSAVCGGLEVSPHAHGQDSSHHGKNVSLPQGSAKSSHVRSVGGESTKREERKNRVTSLQE